MKRGIAVLFCFWSTLCIADELKVVVVDSIAELIPERVSFFVSVLEKAGFEVNLTVLPQARALAASRNGQADLDLFRARDIMDAYAHLIRIEPPVLVNGVLMAVHIDNQAYCDLRDDELSNLNVVVKKGLRVFPELIAPLVRNMFFVESQAQAIKMVQSDRIDATFLTPKFLETARPEQKEVMHFCKRETMVIASHSYLHKNSIHWRPIIEAAYREALEVQTQ